MVNMSINAIKFEEITVTFHPNNPSTPTIIETEKKPLHVDISGDCKELKNSVKNKPFSNKNLYFWDRSKNIFVEGQKYIDGKISKTKLDQVEKRCIKAGVAIP